MRKLKVRTRRQCKVCGQEFLQASWNNEVCYREDCRKTADAERRALRALKDHQTEIVP